jgi:hypothetical protein
MRVPAEVEGEHAQRLLSGSRRVRSMPAMPTLWLGLMRRTSALVVATALTGGLLACGGDGNGGNDGGTPGAQDTPTTRQTDTATPEPTQDPAQERAIAQRAQLRLEDFPADWQENDESENDPADCEGIRGPREATSGRAASPDFQQGSTTFAASAVFLYADEAGAGDAFGKMSARETRVCLAEQVADRVAENADRTGELTIGEPSTARVRVDPLGDEREGGRVTLPLSVGGFDVDLTVDYVFVRVGRGVALLVFADVLTPFDEDLRADLTSKVVRRVAAELS